MKKRKHASRGLLIFLCVMAFLTFFARTFYYGMLPKVEICSVNGGVLQTRVTGGEFTVISEKTDRTAIPVNLAGYRMQIQHVWVRNYTTVTRGQALFDFDAALGAYALERAQRMKQRSEETLQAWDMKYRASLVRLSVEIATLQVKRNDAASDHAAIDGELQLLQDEMDTLERVKILDGISRVALQQELADATALFDELNKLAEQDWIVQSKVDGWVIGVNAEAGAVYTGFTALVETVVAGYPLRVGIISDDQLNIPSSDHVFVYMGNEEPNSMWRFAGETNADGKIILWAEPIDPTMEFHELKTLNFRIDSDFLPYLVPNSAVIGGKYIYVLDSRYGAWGAEELYARRVEVKTLQSDDMMEYVPVGLAGDDRIIIRWDRPFNEGDTVVLPYK